MATEKIYLGQLTDRTTYGNEKIWLSKHKWECGWYWGFGYVGNRHLHFHIKSLLTPPNNFYASQLFWSTNITDDSWWIIRDLFIQAYALKEAAAVYRHGGHQKKLAGTTDIIENLERAKQINADLEKVLDKVWDFIQIATMRKP